MARLMGFSQDLVRRLCDLKSKSLSKQLVGNSMHVPTVGSACLMLLQLASPAMLTRSGDEL